VRGAPSGRLSRSGVHGSLRALILALFCAAAPATAASCLAATTGEAVIVRSVIDGDTVRLADGTSVRLLGVNTPELGHRGRSDEPYAVAATQLLRSLVPADGRMTLIPGQRREDRHGRRLGWLVLGGDNVAEHLLADGLAWAVAVPPDTSAWDCLRGLEQRARDAGLGIWQDGAQPVDSSSDRRTTGFVHLRGHLTRAQSQPDGRWFGEIEGGLWLTAYPDALSEYPTMVDVGVGRLIEVRGWLSPGRRPRLVIRHPGQLTVVTEPPEDAGL